MELDLLWGKKQKIWPNVGNRVFEVRTPGRQAGGDRTSLGWQPLSLPVRLRAEPPPGPPAPARLASPGRSVGLAGAPQLRDLTPQVWETRGDLLSGGCGRHSHPMWAGPQGMPGGEGTMGGRDATVTASHPGEPQSCL